MGRRSELLDAASAAIERLPGTKVMGTSHYHTTRPVGGPPNQENYLNAALQIQTPFAPHALLTNLLEIERGLGRDRSQEPRNGPRTIDIDILMYNDLVLTSPELTLPHPRMHSRTFVLMPLCDIAPNLIHPILLCPISLLAARCYAGGACEPADCMVVADLAGAVEA